MRRLLERLVAAADQLAELGLLPQREPSDAAEQLTARVTEVEDRLDRAESALTVLAARGRLVARVSRRTPGDCRQEAG